MRVALIAPDILDYAVEFAQTIAEAAEVLLCISDHHEASSYPRSNDRLEIRWLTWPRQRDLFGSVPFITRLASQIRQWKPDLVHILMSNYIWTDLLLTLLKGVPILTTVHDVRLHLGDLAPERIPGFFTDRIVNRSDGILTHGDGLCRDAAKKWSLPPERCFVLPHVPLWRYREVADEKGFTKPNDGVFRVLFFGRICEYKGLRYLLKAIPLLQKSVSRLRIIIAGSGDNLAHCRDLISNQPNVEMHDRFVSIPDAARLFSDADLLALPYTEASQSGVLMLAMTFGLPVVASDVGELGNTVKETGMGLLVPPRNEVALAEAMTEIARNADLRSTLSKNAVSAAAGPFSRKTISDRALVVYSSLLQSRRPHKSLHAESCLIQLPAALKNGQNRQ